MRSPPTQPQCEGRPAPRSPTRPPMSLSRVLRSLSRVLRFSCHCFINFLNLLSSSWVPRFICHGFINFLNLLSVYGELTIDILIIILLFLKWINHSHHEFVLQYWTKRRFILVMISLLLPYFLMTLLLLQGWDPLRCINHTKKFTVRVSFIVDNPRENHVILLGRYVDIDVLFYILSTLFCPAYLNS